AGVSRAGSGAGAAVAADGALDGARRIYVSRHGGAAVVCVGRRGGEPGSADREPANSGGADWGGESAGGCAGVSSATAHRIYDGGVRAAEVQCAVPGSVREPQR